MLYFPLLVCTWRDGGHIGGVLGLRAKVVSKTKHLKTKTEVRSTQISKTKHQKLETTVGWRTRTLCLARRKPYQVEATNASAPPKVHKSIPRFYVKPANRWTERFYIGSPVLLAKRYLISIFRYTWKFIVYASVNSTCTQPPLPPSGWPLGISIFFFALDRVRTKNEGKCPELCQHCNIFHWLNSRIVLF